MNSRMVVAIAALGALAMGGCAKPKPGDLAKQQDKYTKYRAIHKETMLRPGPKIVTKNIERLEVRYKGKYGFKREYDALVGPNPDEVEAIASYKNPAGRMVAEAGWIYASGECPYVETTLVEATAHGTDVTIIVQIDMDSAGNPIHRVYLLNISGSEWAEVRIPPQSGTWYQWYASAHSSSGGYSYVEVQGVNHTGPSGANTLNPFLSYVVETATLAGVSP